MNWLLLAQETTEHVEEPSFTDIDFATAAWVWVAFIVTFLILRKVAWPALMNTMEARELRIAEGLKKAEEAEARARELAEKQEQLLEEARQEAQKFLAETRAAAENVKNDMISAAQAEIAQQRERAKKEISLEVARAVDELKRATVELTLEASARLLKRELRDDDHRRLAREVVEEVASGRWVVEEVASN
jgi:F-type H+-transporting ATPase subunit b